MGATESGNKELIAVEDGYRESEQSWLEVLEDLKARGLADGPKLASGDGALGFWKAMTKVYPASRHQRCWFHKSGNVLNKMPKSVHGKAKADVHEIWMAATREEANQAFDRFVAKARRLNDRNPMPLGQCFNRWIGYPPPPSLGFARLRHDQHNFVIRRNQTL